MKITKRQLRKIVKEEKQRLLNEEPSDYYRDYKSGSISYEEYQQMVKEYERRTGNNQDDYSTSTRRSSYASRPRKTSYVGPKANADQIAAIDAAPTNNFLTSLLIQLRKGRGLSDKQKSIARKILAKHDPTSVALFEASGKVTKRQLRRIIKEEQALQTAIRIGNSAIMPNQGAGSNYIIDIEDWIIANNPKNDQEIMDAWNRGQIGESKITKKQLKKIINEEYNRILVENIRALVKKVASAGTPEIKALEQAKEDSAYGDFSDAQKAEFEIALEEYYEEMMGF